MFEHSYSGACKYGNARNKVLCFLNSKTENFHGQNGQITGEEKNLGGELSQAQTSLLSKLELLFH